MQIGLRSCVDAVQNDQEKNEDGGWEIQPQRISIISGPNKQVIFESINSKFVVNLSSCARFHVQQLINVLYAGWQ